MSIYLKPDLFVIIKQMQGERSPQPLPLSNGFSEGLVYEVLGIHTASESAEAFLILRNDRDEMWFISNRHVRVADIPMLYHIEGGLSSFSD
jgi:hypothetical protein